MTVEIAVESPAWKALPLQDIAARAEAAVLTRLDLAQIACEISILACSDARIAELNADFRGKPSPTNVLSWPSEDRAAARPGAMPRLPRANGSGGIELGDIAIAWETCLREAADMGKPLTAHVTHLLVHGMLHLLGFDHERDADATLMEGLETGILGNLGLPDPYDDEGDGQPGPSAGNGDDGRDQ